MVQDTIQKAWSIYKTSDAREAYLFLLDNAAVLKLANDSEFISYTNLLRSFIDEAMSDIY